MSKTKTQKQLLRKVARAIRRNPKHYDQGTWISNNKLEIHMEYVEGKRPTMTACGTAGCIAGWTAVIGDWEKKNIGRRVKNVAQDLLGLDDYEAGVLFSPSPGVEWPYPFSDQWHEANTPKDCANVAADYLEHIAKTGEVE